MTTTLQFILDALPDAIIWTCPVFRPDGTVEDFEVRYSNKTADEGIRHPKGSLLGLRILSDEVPSAQSAQANFYHFLEVYQTGAAREYSFFAHHANRYFDTYRTPLEGGVLSATRDRQALRAAEEKERRTSLALKSIVDHSPTGILVYDAVRDAAGTITDFRNRHYNDRANELTGFSNWERENLSFRRILEGIDAGPFFDKYVQVVETGVPDQREQYIKKCDKWLNSSIVKLDDGFLAMLSDITESKRALNRIEEQKNLLDNILRHSSNGISVSEVIRDASGQVVDARTLQANDAAVKYIGLSKEVYLSKTATEIDPNIRESPYFHHCVRTLETGEPFIHQYYLEATGRWLELTVSKMDDDRLIHIFTDVTSIKVAQLQLEHTVEELRRSNASLEEFAYAASHDLQEPLRKIYTFSDRLKLELADQMNSSQHLIFNRMQSATTRMRTLIDDLLAYSQVSARGNEFAPVDLGAVVQQVVHDLEAVMTDTGAVVRVDSLPGVAGNERQLRQMFQNLIGNAIKYRQPGVTPEVSVTARPVSEADKVVQSFSGSIQGPYHLIEVRDNGIGFEQEHAEKIFQVFHRLHGRAEYEGTGIGLAIVQKVVTNHKGYIRALSEPGKGATFQVLLPRSGSL